MKNRPYGRIWQRDAAIMEKVKMRMQMSDSKGVFKSTMSFDFKNVSEISDFYKALEESGDQQQGLAGMMPAGGPI